MGEFDPQLVASYAVKIEKAQMRIQIRMELGKVPGIHGFGSLQLWLII
jgi:hypothetical protein